jgi:hypothetical protein
MNIAARVKRPGLLLLAALLGAHVVLSVATLSPGYLSVDEGTYHVMVQSLADHGSLAFSNGYEEFPSLELITGSVRVHEGRLVPVTPILFAIVSLPFYRAAGYAGLFVVNNLAFLGILALTAALAHRLFRDRALAMLSIAILGLCTYAWEYSQAAWPHASSAFAVLAAFYAALRGLESSSYAGALRWNGLAGMIAGVGIGVRLDVALAVPCLMAPFLFTGRRRLATSLAIPLGTLPALAVLSATNHLKFGIWSPFSYGPAAPDSGVVTAYLPLAGLGLVLLAAVRAGQHPGIRALLRQRKRTALAAGVVISISLLGLPGIRQLAVSLATGAAVLLGDLRLLEPRGFNYFGYLKKSLLQSCPYLVLLVMPLFAAARGGEQRGRIALLSLVPAAFVATYASFSWHGGQCLNLRYFVPILPFTSILVALALRSLFGDAGDRARTRAWIYAWLTAALYWSLTRWSSGSPAHTKLVYLAFPLCLSLVTLVLALGDLLRARAMPRCWREGLRAAAVAGLVWAGLVAFLYDYAGQAGMRDYTADMGRRASEVVAEDSILFVLYPDPFFSLIELDRVRLAIPLNDNFRDFRALLAFNLAEQRPVYAVFPDWMWRSMQRADRLDGLERQVLWEHASVVMARLREQRE